MPSRIDRRSLLKGAAAAAAGTGAALLTPGLASATARSLTSGPQVGSPDVRAMVTGRGMKPATPEVLAQPGISFRSYFGYDFAPLDTSADSNFVNTYGARSQTTGTATPFFVNIDLPDGALIAALYFTLLANDTNNAEILFNDLTNGSGFGTQTFLNSVSTPTTFALVPNAPVVVDNSSDAYILFWVPGTVGATHQIMSAAVGFYNESRLVPFPNPRRVVDGHFATSNPHGGQFTSGNTYGPYDATQQITYPSGALSSSGVPAGAQAAFCAVQSYTPGVLTLFPDGTTDPGIANYSGTGNLGAGLNMVYMLVPLSSAGKFKIHSYISGEVFVDVWGFLA